MGAAGQHTATRSASVRPGGEQAEGATLKRWCRNRNWTDPTLIQGSLEGRVLTAGSFNTERPPPMRPPETIPLPTATGGAAPAEPTYSGPPGPPAPVPQSLAAHGHVVPDNIDPTPSMMPQGPVPPSRAPLSDQSLGEPGFGDFTAARAELGRDEPAFVMGDLNIADDDAFERELAAREEAKSTRNKVLLLGALVVSGLLLAAAVFFVVLAQTSDDTPITDVAQVDADGAPDDPNKVTTDGEEAEAALGEKDVAKGEEEGDERTLEADVAPEPQPEPQPAPAPVPVPAPEPVAPKAPSTTSLIDRGWSLMSKDPAEAATAFKQALDAGPSNAEAAYGYGYAMAKQGDSESGKTYLCQAVNARDERLANEVRGVASGFGISCD